jgi:Ser/Thr protein kinase RdoA (MazF antagonist)
LFGQPGASATRVVLLHGGYPYVSQAAALAWMAALSEQTDVVTPQLIPAQNGDEVVTAVINDHPLNVDAVTFVSGCTAEERPEAVGFDQLGRITAAMHDHVQGWAAPDYFTRFSWDAETMIGPDGRWGNWRHAPGLTKTDEAVVERAATEMQRRLAEFGCALLDLLLEAGMCL